METKTPSAPKRHTVLKALICLVVAGIISEAILLGLTYTWAQIQTLAVKSALGHLTVEVKVDSKGISKSADDLSRKDLEMAFYLCNHDTNELRSKISMARDELTGE